MKPVVNGSMSAADLMAELAADPEYQAMIARQDAELAQQEAALAMAERPIVEDLHAAGFPVQSVYDLVNSHSDYPAVVPVLLRHLEANAYPERIMEGLGRALAVPSALPYWDHLMRCYREATTRGAAEGVAVALITCMTPAQLPDIVELAQQRGGFPDARIYLVEPLLTMGGERGLDIVEHLREDPEIGQWVTNMIEQGPDD